MANDTTTSQTYQMNKLQEQATAKADLSYSYWASNQLNTPAPLPQPKALTEEEARQLQEEERKKSSTGASAWNHAGTFEERNMLQWAKGRCDALMLGLSSGSVTISKVASCSGDANIFIIRGKKRCGFDLELELKWQAAAGDKTLEGTLKVSNAASDDLDDVSVSASVTDKQGAAAGDVSRLCKEAEQLLPKVVAALQHLHEELKQR